MKPPSKWDLLLEHQLKPRAVDQQLVIEAAKLLARELAGEFPPDIGGLEEGPEAARFRVLFDEPRQRPDESVYRAACHLAKLELRHDVQEVEVFLRAASKVERDRLAMQLLARWLTEQLYLLKEQLQTPLPRARLVEIVEQTEARLFPSRN